MKRKLLITIVCTMLSLHALASNNDRYAPVMWPTSYTVKSDKPFVYPLEEIGVKFDRAIKLMGEVEEPVAVICNGVVVAEAKSLEITNNESSKSVEGILNVHFEKQNLPKAATYELRIPEGVIGWTELEDGVQLVNGASSQKFSVPASLGPTQGTEEGLYIPDSNHFIVFYWGYETKAVGEPKFDLYREDEKIAELPAFVTWDWNLGQAYPVFNEYMTFDYGVNYSLVLPAGAVSAEYREDITNEEVVFDFIGGYTNPALPFTYSWCSLYTDHSGILGEVSFTFNRPIEIAEDAKIQLYEIYPSDKLIMEVTPWLNTDANCWLLVCDFGGYYRDDEWGYTIVIPEGAIRSNDGYNVSCARSEFSSETTDVGNIALDETISAPYYNLQGIKVANPQPGCIYIHNGKKIIFQHKP